MKKVVVALIVVAGLALLGWRIQAKLSQAGAESKGGPPGGRRGGAAAAVAVELAPVRRATLRQIGRFTGTLLPRASFVVAPKIAGRLERLTVDIGDSVTSGQLIAELDDVEYTQQVEQARAELDVARANVKDCESALYVADRELVRVKALYDSKISSESELDTARASQTACSVKKEVALAGVTRCEAALKAAEARLAYTQIHAVWEDGGGNRVVGERFVDAGTMLRANDPIVSILDNSRLVAQIDVIERDYPLVRVGQMATIATDAFPGREFPGQITRIAPQLKETSRQARVEIEVPNAEQLLKPGMFVRVQIEFACHENVTVVPLAALARRDERQGVFLVDRKPEQLLARFVPVTLGLTEGELAEVVEPVDLAGEVITLGHHLLEDGAAIRLPEASATPGATGRPARPVGTRAPGATGKPKQKDAARPGGRP